MLTKPTDFNVRGSEGGARPEHASNAWSGKTQSGRNWRVLEGDAETALQRIDAETAACVVTSPPYYSLRDYGVDGQIGLEDKVDDYVASIVDVMGQVKRVLRKDGLLFLNIGDTYYSGKGKSHGTDKKSNKRRFGLRPVDRSGGLGVSAQRKSLVGVPWRVALEMASRGWVLRSAIIWHKEKCLPEPVADRPSRSYENVFMFSKDRFYHFNRDALTAHHMEEDMWTIPARPRGNNGLDTAPFPDELVKRCLEVGCAPGGLVLDPFLGSGTTARVALELGHDAIGIELNGEFCRHAVKQLGRM